MAFLDTASKLVELPKSTDSFLYLKEDYFEAMRALKGDTHAKNVNTMWMYTVSPKKYYDN